MSTDSTSQDSIEAQVRELEEKREEKLKEISSLIFSFPGRRMALGKLYAEVAEYSRMLGDDEAAYEQSTKAIFYLSAESKNEEAGELLATCYAFAGYSSYVLGNYSVALVHYNQYLEISNRLKKYDKNYRSTVFLDMLYCYNKLGMDGLVLGMAKKFHPAISKKPLAQSLYYKELAIAYFYQHIDCLNSMSIMHTLASYVDQANTHARLSGDKEFEEFIADSMERIQQFLPEGVSKTEKEGGLRLNSSAYFVEGDSTMEGTEE